LRKCHGLRAVPVTAWLLVGGVGQFAPQFEAEFLTLGAHRRDSEVSEKAVRRS
jgi:hypothetical protein